MKRTALTAIILLWAAIMLRAEEGTFTSPMTLQECLVYARDHSSVNLQSRYSYEQQRIALQNSAMQFLPYISDLSRYRGGKRTVDLHLYDPEFRKRRSRR